MFLFSKTTYASVIFQDDFDDGDYSDWTVQRNKQWAQPLLKCKNGTEDANWKIDSNRLGIKISGPGCVTEITPNNWSGSLSKYEINLDMSFVLGTDKNLAFRYFSPDRWYDLKFDSSNNTVMYQQIPHSGDTLSTVFSIPNGNTYHIRVIVDEGRITTFINGSQILQSVFEPNTEFSPDGKLALQASVGNDYESEVYFDNIVVTSIDPSPTSSPTPTPSPTPTSTPTPTPTSTPIVTPDPTSTPTPSPTPTIIPTPTSTPLPTSTPIPTPAIFPAFYQTDPLWKSKEYDSASSWNPLDPSFGRWGCAVTSATMILKYYGITTLPNGLGTTPGNFDDWLKSTPGGYVNEGLLNWQMVSKVTAIMHLTNPFWTKLEYSWGSDSLVGLKDELTSGRPTILQVLPGHFVTAYQVGSQDKIDLVDPFFPKTTLADYDGKFVSMRRFRPSFTDFSHITFFSGSGDKVSVEQKQRNGYTPLQADVFTEALWGQPGNEPSGPATKILDLSKPKSGQYRIKLSRAHPAKTHYTLILTNRESDQQNFEGNILAGNTPRYFEIGFSPDATPSATHKLKVDFDTLNQDYDIAKQVGGVRKKYDCRDITLLLGLAEKLYRHNRPASRMSFELFAKLFTKQRSQFDPEIYSLIYTDIKYARDQLY